MVNQHLCHCGTSHLPLFHEVLVTILVTEQHLQPEFGDNHHQVPNLNWRKNLGPSSSTGSLCSNVAAGILRHDCRVKESSVSITQGKKEIDKEL